MKFTIFHNIAIWPTFELNTHTHTHTSFFIKTQKWGHESLSQSRELVFDVR